MEQSVGAVGVFMKCRPLLCQINFFMRLVIQERNIKRNLVFVKGKAFIIGWRRLVNLLFTRLLQ